MKIIVAEKISASAVAELHEPGWTVLTADQLDGKLAEHLETADALIVRSAVQVDGPLLDAQLVARYLASIKGQAAKRGCGKRQK